MSYKDKDSISTGIHTRINDMVRISSAWRFYGNENFEICAWETLMWDGTKVIGQYETARSADAVIELHQRLVKEYREESQ